jgi:hypothetical protein
MTDRIMSEIQGTTRQRRHAAVAALAVAASMIFAISGAQAEQSANLDNWLDFDNKNSGWTPGFDRSFAPEVDEQQIALRASLCHRVPQCEFRYTALRRDCSGQVAVECVPISAHAMTGRSA